MATIPASENEFPQLLLTEGAAPSTPAAGLIVAYAKAGGVYAWKDDAGAEHLVAEGDLPAHLADASDAHDASAISVLDAGNDFTATNVEDALAELFAAIAGGGIPATTVNAKGDLLAATADDTVTRLGVGSNGTQLTAASGETTGLLWAAAPTAGRATRTAGDVTTTSTSFTDLTGASITITTLARRVMLTFTGAYTNSATNHGGFDFAIDGTRAMSAAAWGLQIVRNPAAGDYSSVHISYLTDVLSAASHTFKVQWRVGGGTGTVAASTTLSGYSFHAVEVGAVA